MDDHADSVYEIPLKPSRYCLEAVKENTETRASGMRQVERPKKNEAEISRECWNKHFNAPAVVAIPKLDSLRQPMKVPHCPHSDA